VIDALTNTYAKRASNMTIVGCSRQRAWRFACTLSLALFAGTGCAATDDGNTVEADILTRYERYWDVLTEVRSRERPGWEDLEQVARGLLLRDLVGETAHNQRLSALYSGAPKRVLQSLDVEPERAYVVDCINMSSWLLIDSVSRNLIEDQHVRDTAILGLFTLARDNGDGEWYVTRYDELGECSVASALPTGTHHGD
jgi:hypothetical protein